MSLSRLGHQLAEVAESNTPDAVSPGQLDTIPSPAKDSWDRVILRSPVVPGTDASLAGIPRSGVHWGLDRQ